MGDTYSHYSRIAEAYSRYRPRYPRSLLEWLRAACGLTAEQVVADIGAGTGQLAELFLEHGNRVFGVEPNPEMRTAAERLLQRHPAFTAVAAAAEQTALAAQSVDLIVVGNAFHWFRHEEVRREFGRILAPQGWVVLLWNLERSSGSPFARAFEECWRTYIDPEASFAGAGGRGRPGYLDRFFGADEITEHVLDNEQVCDLAALQGLARSFLKAPQEGDPRYPALHAELEAIFNAYQVSGTVTLKYDLAIVCGQLRGS